MLSLLDKLTDIICEFASERQQTFLDILSMRHIIADNLVKIALFGTESNWKRFLIRDLKKCQLRKLNNNKYPTKEEYFKMLYIKEFVPEEPWNKSKCYALIINALEKYKDSRDLSPKIPFDHVDFMTSKDKAIIDEINFKIKEFIEKISKLLSEGEMYSSIAKIIIDEYVNYWKK